MKDMGLVALVTAAGLAFVAAAVFAGRDTSVLVPPPDAVAETFVRALAMERYELARQHLARGVERETSASELRAAFDPLRAHTGKPDQVTADTSSATGTHARVLATLEGRRGNAAMYVDLVRERGLWKVAAWRLVAK